MRMESLAAYVFDDFKTISSKWLALDLGISVLEGSITHTFTRIRHATIKRHDAETCDVIAAKRMLAEFVAKDGARVHAVYALTVGHFASFTVCDNFCPPRRVRLV